MSDLISDIGISLAKTDILRALEDARNAEARLARKMVEAGKDPLPPLFFSADEHAQEMAKLRAQRMKPKPQFYWGTIGGEKRLRDGEPPPAPAPDSNARLFVAQVRAALADTRISIALLPKVLEVLLTVQNDDEPDAKARHRVESAIGLAMTMAGKKREPPKPVAILPTAAEIARAGAIARGEIVPMPTDPLARAIVLAARKARNEPDPEKPL